MRTRERMGTGSEPVAEDVAKTASCEVPVPILSRALTAHGVRLLGTVLLLACGAGAAGDDWRQFRGNDHRGATDERGLPSAFDPATGANVAWKAPLPGKGPSSPIVVGDRVFVTAATGPRQDRLHVLCFSAESGRPLWQRQFWATGHTVIHPFGGVAAPTPASDGRYVFAFFSSNDLVCLDLDGNLQWFRGLAYESPNVRNDVGMASSPAVIDQTVVVQLESQGDAFVAGLDTASGETRWRVDRERTAVWSSPTVLRGPKADANRVLLQGRQKLTALDPRSGRVAWEYEAPCATVASATTCGDRVFLPAIGLHALGVDAARGSIEKLWYDDRLRAGNSSPIVYDGHVYVIKSPSILMCADVQSGETTWQLRLKGPFWATPVAADGKVYCVNHGGLVQIVETGEKGRLAAEVQIDEGVLATPAVAGRAIYFRTDKHLWKIAEGATRKPIAE